MSNADDSDADTPDGRNPPANPPAAVAFAVSDSWSMPRNEKYEHYLCHFMGFVHGRSSRYPKGTVFTRSQLLEL